MDDLISRQAALEKVRAMQTYKLFMGDDMILVDKAEVQTELMMLPTVQPEVLACGNGELVAKPEPQWILCSERMPEDLVEVNVTWVNRNPESYYESIKDKLFTTTAVYYKGEWYWLSATCVDYLAEYGRCDWNKVDKAIEIVAWMPLPEPYKSNKKTKW